MSKTVALITPKDIFCVSLVPTAATMTTQRLHLLFIVVGWNSIDWRIITRRFINRNYCQPSSSFSFTLRFAGRETETFFSFGQMLCSNSQRKAAIIAYSSISPSTSCEKKTRNTKRVEESMCSRRWRVKNGTTHPSVILLTTPCNANVLQFILADYSICSSVFAHATCDMLWWWSDATFECRLCQIIKKYETVQCYQLIYATHISISSFKDF